MSSKKTSSFELRSGSVDTLFFTPKTSDFGVLRDELTLRLETTPEFFANDGVVLDMRRCNSIERLAPMALTNLLSQSRMRPIGVVVNEAQRKWAEQEGLPILEALDRRAVKSADAAAPAKADGARSKVKQIASTMMVDKPLRSGQQIYAQGDLVVLAPISYGAEVLAEGNLYIYAPLRGRALAGVHGKQDARIFCTCLEAELISIAGNYYTAEAPQLARVHGKSVQVMLIDEKLLIEPLRLT